MKEENHYEILSSEEKVQYLEGKIEILERNINARKAEYSSKYSFMLEEKSSLIERIEEMKKEISLLQKQIYAKDIELLGHKRIKSCISSIERQQNTDIDTNIDTSTNTIKAVKRSSMYITENNDKNTIIEKVNSLKLHHDTSTIASTKEKRGTIETIEAIEADKEQEQKKVEWILSQLKDRINLDLDNLTAEKLKIFGRFFKKEFNAIYSTESVIRQLEDGVKSTRAFVKSILYLSDREEVVQHLLPYLFKRHIIPEGTVYIKDIVKILHKIGIDILLSDSDTIADALTFFNECKESLDLLWLFQDLCKKCPQSVAHLISEEYLLYISKAHPEAGFSIIKSLEKAEAGPCTKKACEILYDSLLPDKYVPYIIDTYSFYFGGIKEI